MRPNTKLFSAEVASKGESDQLGVSEAKSTIEIQQLTDIQLHKAASSSAIFWLSEAQTESMELGDGDKIRLKTKQNSPFVGEYFSNKTRTSLSTISESSQLFLVSHGLFTDSIGKIDAASSTVSNYAGGQQVGASWTDKVMQVKAQSADSPSTTSGAAAESGDGAADDEWVRARFEAFLCHPGFVGRQHQRCFGHS